MPETWQRSPPDLGGCDVWLSEAWNIANLIASQRRHFEVATDRFRIEESFEWKREGYTASLVRLSLSQSNGCEIPRSWTDG